MQTHLILAFPVEKAIELVGDHHVRLAGALSSVHYPEPIRCVTFIDFKTSKTYDFLTNNFAMPAITISTLCKQRWQVELFFKWIKQHLRIKAFYGKTEIAVKTQIWVAIATYVSIAIMKKTFESETFGLRKSPCIGPEYV